MKRKEIKYIGFYDVPNSNVKRVSNLAATNKMDYICDAIIEAGFDVRLVSPSWTAENGKFKWINKETKVLKKHKKVTLCPNFVSCNKLTRNLKIIFSLTWLFFWLLKNTKKDEKILMYHVQWLSLPVRWAKKIRGFQLILEVEEIFSEVWEFKSILNKWEKEILEDANMYIAVSDLLADRLGPKVKAILYGSYNLPISGEEKPILKDYSKINLVYAGSVDSIKGGAFKSLECILLLSDVYQLHVLGHGNYKEIELLKEKIEEFNAQLKREAIIYHGVLRGVQFSQFLMKCDIALNPQNEGEYMNTAFPSKIINYLSHNLHVVSSPVESIKKSRINKCIYISSSDNTKDLVEAIMNVNLNNLINNSLIINDMHRQFIHQLKEEILI